MVDSRCIFRATRSTRSRGAVHGRGDGAAAVAADRGGRASRGSPIRIARSMNCGITSAGPNRGGAIRIRARVERPRRDGISVCVGSNFDRRLRGVVRAARAAVLGRLPVNLVGSRFSEATSVVFSGRLRPSRICRRRRCFAWVMTWRTTCAGPSAPASPGYCWNAGAPRPSDLPHVTDLTALVQSNFSRNLKNTGHV